MKKFEFLQNFTEKDSKISISKEDFKDFITGIRLKIPQGYIRKDDLHDRYLSKINNDELSRILDTEYFSYKKKIPNESFSNELMDMLKIFFFFLLFSKLDKSYKLDLMMKKCIQMNAEFIASSNILSLEYEQIKNNVVHTKIARKAIILL